MLGIVIVGAGAIAGVHTDAHKEFVGGCEIRVVCDLYADKAEELLEKKGIQNTRAYKSLEETPDQGGTDVASVCLPPSTHCGAAIHALNHGCHVLMEEPMVSSLEECDKIIHAAGENNRLLSVVCQNRFRTSMGRVHRMLEEGTGGRAAHAIVNSLRWKGENYYDLWWRGTWESECGGSFTSHSIHHIDLLQWMMEMPGLVMACMRGVGHHNLEPEDVGVAVFSYPEAMVQLTTSIADHGEEQELIFQTEKGCLPTPWEPTASKPLSNGSPEQDEEGLRILKQAYLNISEFKRGGHKAQTENLLGAIQGGEVLLTSGEEGRKSIELIAAIYKSAATQRTVRLPLVRDDSFYSKSTIIWEMPRPFEKTENVENFEKVEITLGRDAGK